MAEYRRSQVGYTQRKSTKIIIIERKGEIHNLMTKLIINKT